MHALSHLTAPTIRATWITRHPTVAFVVLAYAISWAFWLSLILFKVSVISVLGAGSLSRASSAPRSPP